MEFVQFAFILVAAICAIYLSGRGPSMIRKCNEILTGKAGCSPVDDVDFVTLHYFAGRGRGEPIRLMLEEAGIPYNETSFTKDTWPAAKKAGLKSEIYTFGQVPAIVTSSGISIVQSQAILHYLGRATGMDCDCQLMHQCEVVALGVEDVRSKLSKMLYDPTFSLEMRDDYFKNVAPMWLGYLEKIAPGVQAKDAGFFGGNRLTWVDFLVFDTLDNNVEFGMYDVGRPPVPVLDQFPKLQSFYNVFKERSKVAAYLTSKRRAEFKIPTMPKGTPAKSKTQ